jgi:hypothetical protein
MARNSTKWPQKLPNGRTIDQMAINIPTSSIERPYKIYPDGNFWFENKKSGNPASKSSGYLAKWICT